MSPWVVDHIRITTHLCRCRNDNDTHESGTWLHAHICKQLIYYVNWVTIESWIYTYAILLLRTDALFICTGYTTQQKLNVFNFKFSNILRLRSRTEMINLPYWTDVVSKICFEFSEKHFSKTPMPNLLENLNDWAVF